MSTRFGIVGAGMIAAIHLEALRGLPDVEVTAIMDGGSGKARRLAPELDPAGSHDIAAFAARDDIDILSVASPSGAHLEAGLAAAACGKHCIVEKPLEITLARVDRIIAAHGAAGTRLGGILNTRHTPAARMMKQAVEAGRFGRLTFASAIGPWWRDQAYYDESAWKGTWRLDGGGALMNQGIHAIDLLQWLVASPVASVSGRIATLAHAGIEVEDTGVAVLEFENGALGQIACATAMWPGHFRTLTIAGENGTASLADGGLLFWRFREEDARDDEIRRRHLALPGAGVGAADPSAGVDAEGHRAIFRDFLAAADSGGPLAIDGAECRKAVAIIRAVYESSKRGGAPVSLDEVD